MFQHVILTTPGQRGFEYAVQRALEDEIICQTGAELVTLPSRRLPQFLSNRLRHGTRYGGLRRWVPKVTHELRADVLWVPLMGPEAFELDWFKHWDRRVGYKILYIFDTFESQFHIVRRIVRATQWDLAITSFAEAVPLLERATGRPWLALPQGVPLVAFEPAPCDQRIIAFSAYGRRHPRAHESIRRFCERSRLYYDFSYCDRPRSDVETRDLGLMHAWHLCHSVFTFCWPVETTHPQRAGRLSPATCRWFEAAASASVILGRMPRDPSFTTYFGNDLVETIDADRLPRRELDELWGALWARRGELLERAKARRDSHGPNWSWKSRVRTILSLAGLRSSSAVRPDD